MPEGKPEEIPVPIGKGGVVWWWGGLWWGLLRWRSSRGRGASKARVRVRRARRGGRERCIVGECAGR